MPSVANQSTAPDSLSALQHLIDRYRDVRDYRMDNNNQKQLLVDILASAIGAVLGGANSWLAVERFGRAHETGFRSFLELSHGIPSHATYRLVFLALDPEAMRVCLIIGVLRTIIHETQTLSQ